VHILTYDTGLYPARVSSYRLGRDAPQDYVYIYIYILTYVAGLYLGYDGR